MLVTIDQVSGKSFDYIIIGGGTAGLVVAVRLSEDPSRSVLVLEAGEPNLNDPAILLPPNYASQFGIPQYDWGYVTVPQANANGKSVSWVRGKGLGGSSAINLFQFHRPPRTDIDAFEELGNKGWNWKTLEKYYKRVERFLPPNEKHHMLDFDLHEHGLEGPLEVGYPGLSSGFEKPVFEAIMSLGINFTPEPALRRRRTWLTPVTISPTTRTRSYAANVYYEPNASRSNLNVLTSAHVARISLPKDASGEVTARSVSFLHGGKEYQAFVDKEVVVSAGAIMSPQVLELSGIGDPDVLQKAGVEVVVDLEGVGNNIQEHLNVGLTYQVKEELEAGFLTFDCMKDPEELRRQKELYVAGEKGVFDIATYLMAFMPLSAITPDAQGLQKKYLASIQARIAAGDYPSGLKKQYQLQLDHIKAEIPSHELIVMQRYNLFSSIPDLKRKYVTLMPMLNHPLSRGSIHIKSNNPLEYPEIDPHYFEEEYDIRSFVESFKFVRRVAQQEPLRSIFIFPGPSVQTDEEIIDFLKGTVTSTSHTIGSCSMLAQEDGGVVDNKLKASFPGYYSVTSPYYFVHTPNHWQVYGTTNVRVIDISIIPLHIGGHTQATAYAIGELGADIIKDRVDF
ncbi:alcohol oxidase [Multifurca ochricompacta]|uniref:Alcohol oxidase n=1 Tax=Multifurca ochricompacta TaxID=376703 RepID=A0AAD4M9T4_9AGAM|nr:alcohol oxidase [Multifurca ochricompacta]